MDYSSLLLPLLRQEEKRRVVNYRVDMHELEFSTICIGMISSILWSKYAGSLCSELLE